MITFKSIIVLDTETTSMPQADHNTTKIIELAVLGCEIDHLRQSRELPRVLHKLVLLFNPMKNIYPEASQVSGLTNELLMNVKPFSKEDADLLTHFINRLPSPVCIVAHNGKNFDFPILRRALEFVNKKLPNNVYCADSVQAFRELLPKAVQTQKSETLQRDQTTPKHQSTQPVNTLQHKNVARVLFPDDVLSEDVLSEEIFPGDSGVRTEGILHRPKTYKLKDVYGFLFGKFFSNAHRAEVDSEALLSCIMQCNGFLDWMHKNAIIFNSIPPLF